MTDPLLLPGSDPLSLALYQLARMVASSATVQSLLGVSSVADAMDRIRYKEAEGTEERPHVCLSVVNPLRYQLVAGGEQNYTRPAGEAWLYIAVDSPAEVLAFEQPRKAEEMWAARLFGAIAAEIVAIAGQDQTEDEDVPESHLCLTMLTMIDMSCVPEQFWPKFGRFWWCVISAQWGDQ